MYKPLLNVRTAYNFLESFIKIDDYISFAKTNHFPYIFYNDNLSMFGAMEFYNKAKQAQIKPIIGLTIQTENNDFILYAKDELGFKNLSYLSTHLIEFQELSNEQLINILEQHNLNNLLLVINEKQISEYKSLLTYFQKKITINDIYLSKFGNRDFYANKISYLNQDDYPSFIVLHAIKNSIKTDEINLQNTNIPLSHYPSITEIEKITNFEKHTQIIDEIAMKCNLEILKKPINFVKYKTPNNIPSEKFLESLCKESLTKYFSIIKKQPLDKDYLLRVDQELEVINKMGFADYFLVVWDYVAFAKKNNIMVGPGRGSSAGSLVAFLLRITEVDPIEHGLFFERFLNPERISLPDIDLDFQDDRREEVLEYLFEKYGSYNVALISTFQTVLIKSAIRDVCRAEGIDLGKVNQMTKKLGIEQAYDLEKAKATNQELKTFLEIDKNIIINNTIKLMIGVPRQSGTHAAGVIISNQDLRETVPLKMSSNGMFQTQFDMNYLETLGLIKMDILGLRNLTTLQEIKSLIRREEKDFDYLKLPLNNQKTFQILRQGKTTGIFQLESKGMTRVITEMNVASIDEISIASALFRPGPQEMIPEYVKRKNSFIKSDNFFIDPKLKRILAPTFGIIVYQEQVIEILKEVANFTLAKADLVRRAIGKKDITYMNMVRQEFLQNAITNHYEDKKALLIWDWIEKFSNYGFNKSHSIAYSYISYWLSYTKANYTENFYCSLLNSSFDSTSKINQYLQELNEFGINLKQPSIKNLNFHFFGKNKVILAPLTLISGIGKDFVVKLREIFMVEPKFNDSIFDLILTFNKYNISPMYYDKLVMSGALDLYGFTRKTLIMNKTSLFDFASFVASIDQKDVIHPKINEFDEYQDLYSFEIELLGFSNKTNPIKKMRDDFSVLKLVSLNNVLTYQTTVNALFFVEKLETKLDKNKKEMAFLKIKDDTATIDATIFSSVYESIKFDLVENQLFICEVKGNSFNGQQKIIINKIIRKIKNA